MNILLLHGALGTSNDLLPLSNLLKEKGHTLLSFNFSGHGKDTVWPDQFRIELFAKDLENVIKLHQLKDIPVFGYSMGGYVALYHKAHFENSPLSRIITYGTKFDWSEAGVQNELKMLDPDSLTLKHPEYIKVLNEKHGDRWKSLLRSTAHMLQNLNRLDGLTKIDLEDLDIPVTLIRGEHDRMVTLEETSLANSWLVNSKMITLPDSKHDLKWASLKELAHFIDQFIS